MRRVTTAPSVGVRAQGAREGTELSTVCRASPGGCASGTQSPHGAGREAHCISEGLRNPKSKRKTWCLVICGAESDVFAGKFLFSLGIQKLLYLCCLNNGFVVWR